MCNPTLTVGFVENSVCIYILEYKVLKNWYGKIFVVSIFCKVIWSNGPLLKAVNFALILGLHFPVQVRLNNELRVVYDKNTIIKFRMLWNSAAGSKIRIHDGSAFLSTQCRWWRRQIHVKVSFAYNQTIEFIIELIMLYFDGTLNHEIWVGLSG